MKAIGTMFFGAVMCALLALPTVSFARSWESTIENVERLAEEMNRKADDLGFPVSLGTMNNEYKISEHRCAILGRMLNKTAVIAHLEPSLPTASEDGEEYRFAALSLNNWVTTARHLLKLDRSRRIETWNLDCVGSHEISATESIQSGNQQGSTFYDIEEGGRVLRVLGEVEQGFASKLIAALKAHPTIEIVALGSPGGSVSEAIAAGRAIRQQGLETTLWGNCYSACPLVFIGGTSRTIWSPYPELGFHKISRDNVAIPVDDPSYRRVLAYAAEMGADAEALYQYMISAEPQDMHIPSPSDLCGIATWVQRRCSMD